MSDKATFRPDLEGLRAVAVVLVLLYHARVPGFGGGYVGVDVFFVLSGFLITGLIIRELQATGGLDLPAFYARRARRLLPAAALVLALTMAASVVVLPPLRIPDVTADTIAAALYASNIRFAAQATDYLGSALPPSPVLHFWSLGVEEQFYLFWPALLAVAAGSTFARGSASRGLRRLGITLLVVLAGSFGASLWLTGVSEPWAFFSLPTRAWELALGAVLSLPVAARLVPARQSGALAAAGIAMIVAAGLLFDEATPFPGTAALLPTVGAALVIAGGLRVRPGRADEGGVSAHRSTGLDPGILLRPASILAVPPLRFLGRISYSLYLWHWPILVLPEVAAGQPLPGTVRLGLACLAVGVAAVTQRWVEEPIRRGRFVGLEARRSLALAGVLSAVVVLASASIGAAAGTMRPAGPVVGGDLADVPLPPDPTITAASPDLAGGSPSGHSSFAPPSARPSGTLPPPSPGAVPADLAPPLATARDDLPVIYADGCHLDGATTTPPDCSYGDPEAAVTVVLFGDSHAAQWFPALEQLARTRGWRLVSLTKSACGTPDVTFWSAITKRAYTECDAWREAAIARIGAEDPALVVVSNSRGYQVLLDSGPVPVAEARAQWDAASGRTLDRIRQLSTAVAVIGDTPRAVDDPPVCLSANLDDATACGLPYENAVNPSWTAGEAAVAKASGAVFIDPTPWVCRTDPCATVLGRFLIFRDQHHLTATYARALAGRLYAHLADRVP